MKIRLLLITHPNIARGNTDFQHNEHTDHMDTHSHHKVHYDYSCSHKAISAATRPVEYKTICINSEIDLNTKLVANLEKTIDYLNYPKDEDHTDYIHHEDSSSWYDHSDHHDYSG